LEHQQLCCWRFSAGRVSKAAAMSAKSTSHNPLRARQEEEKEARRQAILDAAEAVIKDHGWDATNFGEIAKRSRLSRSLVYFYFRDREDLFHAICERGLTQLQRRFAEAMSQHRRGLDQAMAIGRAYLEFARTDPLHFQVLTRLHGQHTDLGTDRPSEQAANERGQRCLEYVVQALANGVRDRSIRKSIGDPGLTAVSVWAFTHGLIQIAGQKEPMLEKAFGATADRTIEHGFAVLRGALERT
jgi:AcrR family transcriptional regulator